MFNSGNSRWRGGSLTGKGKKYIFASFLLLLALSGCTSLFFKPGKTFIQDAGTERLGPQDVYFKSGDGTELHGWYFRALGDERGTILVCHGNVENISTHVKLDLWLVEAGYNLFIFDYRGYGRSGGTPDVKGINQDAAAALETVLEKLPRLDKAGGIIVFGKSLGGAVAIHAIATSARKDRVKALIVESSFSSYRAIAREKVAESVIGWPFQYPLSYLVNDDYSPTLYAHKVAPVPLLIMTGEQDGIVPGHHSRIIYETAGQPKELWELAVRGHVKSWTDGATRARLLEYFSRL